jgi:hypothetical protein
MMSPAFVAQSDRAHPCVGWSVTGSSPVGGAKIPMSMTRKEKAMSRYVGTR